MSKCWNCGVGLTDPSATCPLCNCIVEREAGEEFVPTYPYAKQGIKKIQRALGIYVFAAIVAELIVVGINIATGSAHWWVIMVGIFLAYTYVTLKVSVQMSTGYRLKLFMQTLVGLMVVIILDVLLGFQGWSLNYVLPGVFMFLDLVILILMIVNKSNWQSYMPLQMLMIALCVIPYVLYHFEITHDYIICSIAMGVTILFFVGTILIGGSRARDELKRRFHA